MSDNKKFEFLKADDSASERIAAPNYSYWKSVFKQFLSSKVAVTLLALLVIVLGMTIIHPLISQYDNLNTEHINNKSMHFLRPSLEYLFGTDDVGRNMFDKVWAGTNTSLYIAFVSTLITTVLGVTIGMFWGFSKRADAIMIEIYNIISNIPFTLIAMILSYALGSGVNALIFALSCTSWISIAYMIRVQVMIIRDREYNMASNCLGTPIWKIIFHNILPFLVSIIMTQVSRNIPTIISYEVFLSFIGVGLGEQYASLGKIVRSTVQYLESAPYLFVIPLSIAAFISISLYVVGQKLADASDPKTHMM